MLGEFKSEEIAGHKFEDLDSVLQSLGEEKGEKKGKLKKAKVEKTEVKAKKEKVVRVEGPLHSPVTLSLSREY